MFTKGQKVTCVDSHGASSLRHGVQYEVLEGSNWDNKVKVRGAYGNVSWFAESRFAAVEPVVNASSTGTPSVAAKVVTFRSRVCDELVAVLEQIADDNGYRDEDDLSGDIQAEVLLNFADAVGIDVRIENAGLKISAS